MAAKIFVSYAHVDNTIIDDASHKGNPDVKGWISYTVDYLKSSLNRSLGRSDYYQLWFDQQKLRGHHSVTPELKKEVESADTLVIMMSKGWLESVWCQQELSMFISKHEELDKRIFILNLDNTLRENLPAVLQDLVSYNFFQETSTLNAKRLGDPKPSYDDTQYFDRILAVAQDLGIVLGSINKLASKKARTEATEQDAHLKEYIATVFVSLVSNQLDSHRKFIINNLAQNNILALPQKNSNAEAKKVNLSQCKLLIQLLDEDPLVDLPVTDFQEATDKGMKIIQWCEPTLDLSKVVSDQHKKLLESQFLVKSSLSDFSQQVNSLLFPKNNIEGEGSSGTSDHIVFVHTGQEDWSIAQGIANKLSEKGYGTVLPRYDENPIIIDKSINRGLAVCDVMLMLHQHTPADVVDEYLKEAWLKLKKASGDINPDIVICSCTCGDDQLLVHLPGTRVLDCNNEFGNNCIEQFMDGISK